MIIVFPSRLIAGYPSWARRTRMRDEDGDISGGDCDDDSCGIFRICLKSGYNGGRETLVS